MERIYVNLACLESLALKEKRMLNVKYLPKRYCLMKGHLTFVHALICTWVLCYVCVHLFLKIFSEANLILQHYGHFVHEYLTQQQLIREWEVFFSLPEKDQDWETGKILDELWIELRECFLQNTYLWIQIIKSFSKPKVLIWG